MKDIKRYFEYSMISHSPDIEGKVIDRMNFCHKSKHIYSFLKNEEENSEQMYCIKKTIVITEMLDFSENEEDNDFNNEKNTVMNNAPLKQFNQIIF